MSSTNTSVGGRMVTAFFDTEGAARQATYDLVAAGIPQQHITQTGGRTADAQGSSDGDHSGFWDRLTDFFLPDNDRHSYAEGLRRGGTLLKVQTEEGLYTRVLDILDTDGAVEMDGREAQWRTEGWSAPTAAGLAAAPSASVVTSRPGAPPAAVDDSWRTDDVARAAALDGSVPATAAAARMAVRDDSHGRARLRGYRFDGSPDGPRDAEVPLRGRP